MPCMLGAWGDVTVASIHHAWRHLLGGQGDGDAASRPLANREEVDRQVTEAVAITHRLPGFDGVTAEGVMDMLRSQQPEFSVEEMVEESDEEEREAEEEGGEGERGQAAAQPLITAFY